VSNFGAPALKSSIKFFRILKVTRRRSTTKNQEYIGYLDYLDLLKAIDTKNLAMNILDAEMRLFANAYNLADDYIQKYGIVIKK